MPYGRRRVVVTGLGLVTCLGAGVQHVWNRLLQGHSGIRRLLDEEYKEIPCRIAGVVPRGGGEGELDLSKVVSRSESSRMSLATSYALAATDQAMTDAAWIPETDEDRRRTGVAVGMGMVPMEDIVTGGISLRQRGYRKISPYFIPKILVNMAAGHIAMKYGLQGVNHCVSTACTTGAHAIGDAARFIEHGDADVMVCGSAEASVSPLALAGFARMHALAVNFNDRPQEASRPFDEERQGFVMSEGAAVLVLEELEHAMERKANLYGELVGYGLSGDTHHITAPDPDGEGAFRCMSNALMAAKVSTSQLGYINAHATSTPLGDAAEARAIARLLRSYCQNTAVSSTKGSIGHLLGAAGSAEAVFTLMAIHTGCIPPTLNTVNTDPEIHLNFVKNSYVDWNNCFSERIAITNSFGFGGTNASLCFKNVVL